MKTEILKERKSQVFRKGTDGFEITCEKPSAAGSVSQRACVFCGSRVVLYPITDALHLVHGPIGCAAYTWDIRGARSSGPSLHRNSYCTDLREMEVIYGGEKKLYGALTALIAELKPAAAFVYVTCVAGVIGDNVGGVCKRVATETGIPVIPVHSEGFKGTKKDGYKAACDALLSVMSPQPEEKIPLSINIIGDFNVAGENWVIRSYFEKAGIRIIAGLTGDGRISEVRSAHTASLNIVQCAGSMTHLAKAMKERYGIPFLRVSFFGIEDTASALYAVSDFFGNSEVSARMREIVKSEIAKTVKAIQPLRALCTGKRAAVYVGGAFKAISLVKALRHLGMTTVVAGTQTGNSDDYRMLRDVCDDDTVIVDDSNPMELSALLIEKKVDLFIGGVKERPIAYKLGVGFCDHNHERKECLAGFEGMVNFAREVSSSISSPVWKFVPWRKNNGT